MDSPLRIQRIYVKKEWYGAGFGKEMFTFALDQPRAVALSGVWLGVWEHNFKAQDFTIALDLNDLVNTSISLEIPWIQTGC